MNDIATPSIRVAPASGRKPGICRRPTKREFLSTARRVVARGRPRRLGCVVRRIDCDYRVERWMLATVVLPISASGWAEVSQACCNICRAKCAGGRFYKSLVAVDEGPGMNMGACCAEKRLGWIAKVTAPWLIAAASVMPSHTACPDGRCKKPPPGRHTESG